MSIVIAVKKGNKIAVASDSLISEGSMTYVQKTLKHSKSKKIITGWCGIAGHGQVVTHFLNEVLKKNPKDLACAWAMFCLGQKEDHPIKKLATFNEVGTICVYQNNIYGLNASGSGFEVSEPIYAIGSGGEVAQGVALALYKEKYDAVEIAKKSVEIACKIVSSCGLPVHVDYLKI